MKSTNYVYLVNFAMLLAGALPAFGQHLEISITNEGNSDFFVTPLWFGLHDGTHDIFNAGEAASAALQSLAEEGNVAGLQGDFGGVQGLLANAAGFEGAPVIDPGETAMDSVMVDAPLAARYFSFASMVIPSNDSFLGNDDPMAYEIFDASGDFTGPLTIQVFGSNIWDAGTEQNTTMGAAFSAVGGDRADQQGVVSLLGAGGLDNFAGTGIPTGNTIQDLIGDTELLATIQITEAVPEPSGWVLVGLGATALGIVRRRRSANGR